MEKHTPHCKLHIVRQMVAAGKFRITRTARQHGAEMGYDIIGMCAVVAALTTNDFYKSMTSHADHRVWQDVYRPTTPTGGIYLKLTVLDDVLIVSFKEL